MPNSQDADPAKIRVWPKASNGQAPGTVVGPDETPENAKREGKYAVKPCIN